MERMTYRVSLPMINKFDKEVPSTQLNSEVDLCVDLLIEEYSGCKVWKSINKVYNSKTKKPMLVPVLIMEVRGRAKQDQLVFRLARRIKTELCLSMVMVEKFNLENSVQV